MSTQTPTTSTLQDTADSAAGSFTQSAAREALVAWVMEHVTEWERWRNNEFEQRWKEYWRKWRGIWEESDRTRGSERSRLISPAMQQAVEEAVAEMEEAALGEKEGWFDQDDNNSDTRKEDWQAIRLQLLDDMDYANVPGSMVECLLNGAIFGTAIGKIVPDITTERKLRMVADLKKRQIIEGVQELDKIVVTLEPVRPDQFVIDTAVNKPGREGIMQALGMAHRLPRPRHALRAKMSDEEKDDDGNVVIEATYYEVPLAESAVESKHIIGAQMSDNEESNLVTEYHGLVPQALFDAALADGEAPNEIDTRKMVEVVVTIIDDKWCARCRLNENLKGDRDFIAAPWDIIPGSFWGRGVAEKGFNPQKALDAMLRAQMDGMAYTVHPMLGVNAQRRDPRHKIEVAPGKVLYVNGDPREALFPLNFGRTDPAAFTMSGELERLIQISTGTAGSAGPMRTSRGNGTLGGMSLIQGGLAKRHKRTLRLLERHFLMPLIEKFTLRHMQYNEEVYPFIDLRFRVRTAMSLVAREVENETLTQLLQTVPPESPAFYALLGQIIKNTSLKDKGLVLAVIEAVMKGDLPGSAQAQQQPDPLEQERKVADLQEVRSRTRLKDVTAAEKVLNMSEPNGKDKPKSGTSK